MLTTVDQQLNWEASKSKLAAAGALAAGLLTLIGGAISGLVYRDLPNNSSSLVLFLHDHAAELLLVSVVLAVGFGLAVLPLVYLYRATKFRRPELWPSILVLAIVGPLLLALAGVVQQIALTIDSANFATTGSQTYEEAHAVLTSPVVTVATVLRIAGQFGFGLSVGLLSLHAMRAGLLTRFMGVLGIIVGVVLVVPMLAPLPLLQAFWFSALAVLFRGRWPNGTPPAWSSGQSEPWPSLSQQRQAQQDQAEQSDEHSEPHIEPPAQENEQGARIHSASKKKKKRRRRDF